MLTPGWQEFLYKNDMSEAAPAAAAATETVPVEEADAPAAAAAASADAGAEDESAAKMVTLVSKDGDKFQVPCKDIKISKLVETFLANDAEEGDSEEDDPSSEIPLPQVETVVLTKVRRYGLTKRNKFSTCLYFFPFFLEYFCITLV